MQRQTSSSGRNNNSNDSEISRCNISRRSKYGSALFECVWVYSLNDAIKLPFGCYSPECVKTLSSSRVFHTCQNKPHDYLSWPAGWSKGPAFVEDSHSASEIFLIIFHTFLKVSKWCIVQA